MARPDGTNSTTDIKCLRKHAKEVTRDFEKREYTNSDVKLFLHVLRNEIISCMEQDSNTKFHAGN